VIRLKPGWWLDAVLIAAFVALTVALAQGHLLSLDQRVADWVSAHSPRPLYWIARVLNYLGQGGQVLMPLSLLLAALLTWRRRSVRPLVMLAGAFVLTYLTIGPLKLWLHRAAPAFPGPDKTVLFNPAASGTAALSYPSGHLANSLIWYGVIASLAFALHTNSHQVTIGVQSKGVWAVRLGPPLIVFCTTIYTGFHWLTDSIAGVLLGLVLTRIMARIPWDTIPLPRLNGWERAAGLSPTPTPQPASRA
jgi:membrane-associated phospholipid phosphatase